jgi:hypothetical protein
MPYNILYRQIQLLNRKLVELHAHTTFNTEIVVCYDLRVQRIRES